MSRKKTPRIAEFKTLPNAVIASDEIRGNWHSLFGNDYPISLELGCGKGEFTIKLGKEYPGRNFIGIDLKAARLWVGAKNAITEGLTNVRFLQININSILDYFQPNEVSEIFIPFPDPFPKPCKHKKRLVSEKFMDRYNEILVPDGIIHFKTDNPDLYNYTLMIILAGGYKILAKTDDLYGSDLVDQFNSVPSYFEQIFIEKGQAIKYIKFAMPEKN